MSMISTASTFGGWDKEVASGLRMAKARIYELAIEQQGLHQELAEAGWTKDAMTRRNDVKTQRNDVMTWRNDVAQ